MLRLIKSSIVVVLCLISLTGTAQNALVIPPALTGTNFNLNVQTGSKVFYTGTTTPTYGINGAFLSPTIIVNKGDVVTLNVINGLPVSTTMHWHGLHVAAENDGGPHQIILPGTTWSPTFEILNDAATFWYHPHGDAKTELHVGKGLAGMFIVHDPAELALGLPTTYGVDDFPLIVQSKSFDDLQQFSIADFMDTAIMVNGTINPFLNAPAQVIRLRIVNGSSMRSFNFGFSNNMSFSQVATEAGIINAPNAMTRILISPGERTEILVDLSAMNGQSLQLMNYGSTIPTGVYGSSTVGVWPDTIVDYQYNDLNGADFELLTINVGAPIIGAITTIPSTLIPYVPIPAVNATFDRRFVLDTIGMLPGETPNRAAGPFGINNTTFDMDVINHSVALNTTETWTLINKTLIAHPFHIHDISFNILEKSGVAPPVFEQGWKDVVLVMPGDSAKFIAKFTTFADPMTPYMYHCHLLHHEDDGMMGSFIVFDPNAAITEEATALNLNVYPNPSTGYWNVSGLTEAVNIQLTNTLGQVVCTAKVEQTDGVFTLPNQHLTSGIYTLTIRGLQTNQTFQVQK